MYIVKCIKFTILEFCELKNSIDITNLYSNNEMCRTMNDSFHESFESCESQPHKGHLISKLNSKPVPFLINFS